VKDKEGMTQIMVRTMIKQNFKIKRNRVEEKSFGLKSERR
jgi:hypothetical protein